MIISSALINYLIYIFYNCNNRTFWFYLSNDTSNLSDALLRPSRIDLTYEILNPDEKIRKEYFAKKGVEEKDLDKFAKLTEGMSFAQMKEVFIGTVVQGTDIKKVVKRILDPFKCKDYLNKTKPMKGIE